MVLSCLVAQSEETLVKKNNETGPDCVWKVKVTVFLGYTCACIRTYSVSFVVMIPTPEAGVCIKLQCS